MSDKDHKRPVRVKVLLKAGAKPVLDRTLNTKASIHKVSLVLRKKYPKACEIHVRGGSGA